MNDRFDKKIIATYSKKLYSILAASVTTDSKDKDTNESAESKGTAQLNKSLYKGTIKILRFGKTHKSI